MLGIFCVSSGSEAFTLRAACAEAGRAAADTSARTAAAGHPSPTGASTPGSEVAGDTACLLKPIIAFGGNDM